DKRAGYISSSSNEDSVSLMRKGRARKKSDSSKKSKNKWPPLTATTTPAQKSPKKTRKALIKKKSLSKTTPQALQGNTSDSDSNMSIPGDNRKSFIVSRKIASTDSELWHSHQRLENQKQSRQYYRVHAQLARNMSIHNFKSNFGINQPLYIEVRQQEEHDVVTSVFDTLEKAEM
ncbi:hypothetical protein RFI_36305, partial [Reticulomyxa filosa]